MSLDDFAEPEWVSADDRRIDQAMLYCGVWKRDFMRACRNKLFQYDTRQAAKCLYSRLGQFLSTTFPSMQLWSFPDRVKLYEIYHIALCFLVD